MGDERPRHETAENDEGWTIQAPSVVVSHQNTLKLPLNRPQLP